MPRGRFCEPICRLDFGANFYFDRIVSPTADDVTSLSAVGPAAAAKWVVEHSRPRIGGGLGGAKSIA